MLENYINQILQSDTKSVKPWDEGLSLGGRAIPAYLFGEGPLKISLIAGCHADEPTGPRLLRKLVSFFSNLEKDHPLFSSYTWMIIPHANPDGEAVNRWWYSEQDELYDLPRYIRYAKRALPGEDIEYGFPVKDKIPALRPENSFVYKCWESFGTPFDLHASLHSMGFAFGAWYLLDPNWVSRSEMIVERCGKKTKELGYTLHDVDRKGEKGFHRIAPGFCTRPDSKSMMEFFTKLGNEEMASKFHPSSMESIRTLGGNCLTLVSELPFFIIPGKANDISWPNARYDAWKDRLVRWKLQLITGELDEAAILKSAEEKGLRPMPVMDQMLLQLTLISAGLQTIESKDA